MTFFSRLFPGQFTPRFLIRVYIIYILRIKKTNNLMRPALKLTFSWVQPSVTHWQFPAPAAITVRGAVLLHPLVAWQLQTSVLVRKANKPTWEIISTLFIGSGK